MLIAIVPRPTRSHVQQTPKGRTSHPLSHPSPCYAARCTFEPVSNSVFSTTHTIMPPVTVPYACTFTRIFSFIPLREKFLPSYVKIECVIVFKRLRFLHHLTRSTFLILSSFILKELINSALRE